jgi:glutamate racemase
MSKHAHPAISTIVVFDSGIGGLTVHAELVKRLPEANYVFIADDAAFPYGNHSSELLIDRVKTVIGEAISRFNPSLVIIACNTASTVCMPSLREAFPVAFVGTVPAVKPAAARSKSQMISILGTPGTVNREYTHDLIIEHAADCRITLVGSPRLAALAELFLSGAAISDCDVLTEIAPCFKEKDGRRTDAIALACTHYPLLQEIYDRVAPWPVTWVDPSSAIAARAENLLHEIPEITKLSSKAPAGVIFFTSGKSPSEFLEISLMSRGLESRSGFLLPFERVEG